MRLRDEINLSDVEIAEAFNVPDLHAIRFTKKPLSYFRAERGSWSMLGTLSCDDEATFEVWGAQAHEWEPMRDMTVVDFGPIRGVLLVFGLALPSP